MRLANIVHGLLALAWWAAMATPALADPALPANSAVARVVAQSDFDLARDYPRQSGARRANEALASERPETAALQPKWSASLIDQLTRNVTYQPLEGGPTLGLAALGGGRKGRPGLAHVAIDWNF